MRNLVLFILLINGLAGFAQEQRNLQADSSFVELAPKFQVYLGGGFNLSQFSGTGASFGIIHAGIIAWDRLDLNVYYSGILDNYRLIILFPQEHRYEQHNYGIRMNYSFLKGSIRPIMGLGYEFARAAWAPVSDSPDTFSDKIHIFSASVGVGWRILPALWVEAKAGYNIAHDVEIIGLASDAFDGYEVELGAKFRILSF
jgi:hypothetical protein